MDHDSIGRAMRAINAFYGHDVFAGWKDLLQAKQSSIIGYCDCVGADPQSITVTISGCGSLDGTHEMDRAGVDQFREVIDVWHRLPADLVQNRLALAERLALAQRWFDLRCRRLAEQWRREAEQKKIRRREAFLLAFGVPADQCEQVAIRWTAIEKAVHDL